MIPYLNLIKVSLVIGAIAGLFFWHNSVSNEAINKAVTSAVLQNTQEINAKYAERLNDLKVEQKLNQEHLDKLTQASLKEKQNALQNSTTKYNDLLEWLRTQPSITSNDTSSSGNLIRNSGDSESTQGVLNNGLLREDAVDLIQYAQRTEELKVYLNSCYRQYDEVKGTVDAFTKKHNSGTKDEPVVPSEKP